MSAVAETSRLFVALTIPDAIKARLAELQANLRSRLPAASASWPRAENLHLTLRFLGNVARDRIDTLRIALDEVARNTVPIALAAEDVGCFPNVRRPRVLWAGVRAEGGQLENLHRRVADATASFTREPAEGNFVGHVTLARFKQIRRPETEVIARFLRAAGGRRFGAW